MSEVLLRLWKSHVEQIEGSPFLRCIDLMRISFALTSSNAKERIKKKKWHFCSVLRHCVSGNCVIVATQIWCWTLCWLWENLRTDENEQNPIHSWIDRDGTTQSVAGATYILPSPELRTQWQFLHFADKWNGFNSNALFLHGVCARVRVFSKQNQEKKKLWNFIRC